MKRRKEGGTVGGEAPRKGQTELSEFMLKLIATILFTVFLIGGILSISQFKVQINENTNNRLLIDFGENVLSVPCLTERKGLFNETKLNLETNYRLTHPEDHDGLSCLNTSVLTAFRIWTKKREWFFGANSLRTDVEDPRLRFRFPAALNESSGMPVPAKVFIVISSSNDCNNKNEGLNCYNCLEEKKCKNEGCRWEEGICKY